MLKPNPDAKWEMMFVSSSRIIWRLQFSDRYYLEVSYKDIIHRARMTVSDGRLIYYEDEFSANSGIYAQQRAGTHLQMMAHNIAAANGEHAVEAKEIERALVSTIGWKQLASQNI